MTRPKTCDRASAGAIAAAIALLCVSPSLPAAAEDPSEQPPSREVMRTGAGYALRANNSSVPALLAAVGDEEGFSVVDSGKIHLPITATLDDASLDVLLRRLLRGSNYIILYRGGGSGTEVSGRKIEQIILLTGAGLSPTAPANNASPLAGPQVATHAPGVMPHALQPGEQPDQPRRLRQHHPTELPVPGQVYDANGMVPGIAPPFAQQMPPAVSSGHGPNGMPIGPGAIGVTGAIGESVDEPPPPDDATLDEE
jgi:hypothetical protein